MVGSRRAVYCATLCAASCSPLWTSKVTDKPLEAQLGPLRCAVRLGIRDWKWRIVGWAGGHCWKPARLNGIFKTVAHYQSLQQLSGCSSTGLHTCTTRGPNDRQPTDNAIDNATQNIVQLHADVICARGRNHNVGSSSQANHLMRNVAMDDSIGGS